MHSGGKFVGAGACVALFVAALGSGCSDSNGAALPGDGGTTGAGAHAGTATAGAGRSGSGGKGGAGTEEAAGAAGEGAGLGGAAGATPGASGASGASSPLDSAGAGGTDAEPDCGPNLSGPHCEFPKIFTPTIGASGDTNSAVAMSGDGRYITTVSTSNGDAPHSVVNRVSTETGAADNLMPPQATQCTPTAINEDGSWVAGTCFDVVSGTRPFYWTKEGGAAYFDSASGIQRVDGISADAKVLFGIRAADLGSDGAAGAGGSDGAPSEREDVFRWAATGAFLDDSAGPPHWRFGTVLPNRDGSSAIVNADSRGDGVTMVYRWSAATGMQPLTVDSGLGYYDEYVATAVARQLDITVGYSDWQEAHSSSYTALIWDRSHQANVLSGTLEPVACNRDCSIIAGDVTNALGESGPGLLTHLGAPVDHVVPSEAHLLIELLGVTSALDGWSLGSVVALSDDGKVLTGNGRLNGNYTFWVIHLQ